MASLVLQQADLAWRRGCAILTIAERDQIRSEKQPLTALFESYVTGSQWTAATLVTRAQKGDESARQMLSALMYDNVVETLLDRAAVS